MNQQLRSFRHRLSLLLAAGMVFPSLLAGCSKNEEPVAAPTPRPVKTVVVEAPDVGGVRRFPARIDACDAGAQPEPAMLKFGRKSTRKIWKFS